MKRMEHGLSQTYICKKINLSQGSLSHIESGDCSMSIDTLLDLCAILKTTPNYILLGRK
jgi:transcriptional regulator with XRE-family HTH domain